MNLKHGYLVDKYMYPPPSPDIDALSRPEGVKPRAKVRVVDLGVGYELSEVNIDELGFLPE